jgi:GntR family transcriptional repressor for pyruvate dehydrogenase complex
MTDPAGASSASDELLFGEAVRREPRLSDKVAEMMRHTIISRGLLPGTPLPSERDLGDRFGVSRTVIREAVRALAAKGIVEVRTGSGLRVAAVDESTVSDSLMWFIRGGQLEYGRVHEVRRTVEVEMAALAASRRSQEELVALRAGHERFTSVVDDVEQAAQADLDFHALIARATQNELFSVILASIGSALIEIRRDNLAHGSGERTVQEHSAILEAIAGQDADAAREAMAVHLDGVRQIWEAEHGPAEGV